MVGSGYESVEGGREGNIAEMVRMMGNGRQDPWSVERDERAKDRSISRASGFIKALPDII